jgi:hypothetical protein
MKKPFYCFMSIAGFLTCFGVQAQTSVLTEGQSFLSARKALLREKWQPIRAHVNDGYEYDGVEKELVALGFGEIVSCSIDSSSCIFYYKRHSHCLRLDTKGEHVKNMIVVQWSDECPGSPPRPES